MGEITLEELTKTLNNSSKLYLDTAKHLYNTMVPQPNELIGHLCYLSVIQLFKGYILFKFSIKSGSSDIFRDNLKVSTSFLDNLYYSMLTKPFDLTQFKSFFGDSDLFSEICTNCDILQKCDTLLVNKRLFSDDSALPDINLVLESCEKIHSLI